MASSFQQQKAGKSCRLRGKVAVITGGAKGIGAASAKLFALQGAHVVVADILDEPGMKLANSIGGRYIHCDVSKETDVESAIQLALSWKGQLNIMFNNAGIAGPDGSIANLEMKNLESLLDINLLGVVHGLKHAAKAMIKGKKGGSIICTSSSAAIIGGLASHSYTMSKEAILGVMKSSACELGAHGIRVNCISPHGIPTDLLVDAFRKFCGDGIGVEEVGKAAGKNSSLQLGRGARVEDIANGALFLASEEAEFITGQNLVVDGGYTSTTITMRHIYQ